MGKGQSERRGAISVVGGEAEMGSRIRNEGGGGVINQHLVQ
jgi:hypothetical protein